MAEQRRQRYYTWNGERRSLIMWSQAPSDEAAIEFARTHDAWNVVREDGPLAKATITMLWKRHNCDARRVEDGGDLEYYATYGAPGVGQEWRCTKCGRAWSFIYGVFFEPKANVHILSLADVR